MKKNNTKTEPSENIVRIQGIPKLKAEHLEEIRKLKEMPDREIDFSDIPQITDFTGFEVGKFYKPVKQTVSIRLDTDLLYWLKKEGKGYQSRINAILRKEMQQAYKKAA